MSTDKKVAELRSKVISGAKWSLGLRVVAQTFSWLVTIITVRYLTPQDYGLYSMVEVAIELLMLFSTLGIDSALIRQRDMKDRDLSAAFGLLLLVNALFFVGLFFLSDWVAEYFKDERIALLLKVNACIFLLAPLRAIPDALLDRELAFKLKSQIEISASISAAAISVVMAIIGFGVWALVAAQLANFIIRALLLMYFRPWFIKPVFDISGVLEMAKYGGAIMLSGAIMVLAGKSVVLVAGPKLGAESLGFYVVAIQFALLPLSKIMPVINQTMFPVFSRLQDSPENARIFLLKALQVASVIVFPASIGLACLAPPFVLIVFGDRWEPLTTPLTLMLLLTPFRLLGEIFTSPLNALGKANGLMRINVTKFVLLTAGALFLVEYGITGLIAVWYATITLSLILTYRLMRSVFPIGIGDLFQAVAPALVSSLVMASFLFLLGRFFDATSHAKHLSLGIAGGATVFASVLFLLYRPVFDEIRHHLFKR